MSTSHAPAVQPAGKTAVRIATSIRAGHSLQTVATPSMRTVVPVPCPRLSTDSAPRFDARMPGHGCGLQELVHVRQDGVERSGDSSRQREQFDETKSRKSVRVGDRQRISHGSWPGCKKQSCVSALLTLILLLVGAAPATADNIIMNPGFEAGTLYWTFTGAGYIHSADGYDPSHSGSWEAYLNAYPGYGTISQVVATVPGDLYNISFWISSNGGNGTIYSEFGGIDGFDVASPAVGFYTYTEETYTAVAAADTTTFVIGGYGITATYFFDDVSVEQATPEPATLHSSLLAYILLGLTIFNRVWHPSIRRGDAALR